MTTVIELPCRDPIVSRVGIAKVFGGSSNGL
jgi:hypothetical protein